MFDLRYMIVQILVFCCCHDKSSSNNIGSIPHVNHISISPVYNITVNTSSSLYACDARFLSVAISTRHINLNVYGRSEKLRNLALELSPSDVRVGGTAADFMCFTPAGAECKGYADKSDVKEKSKVQKFENFTVTGEQWKSFNGFVSKVGWKLLFNLNLFWWRSDGWWDSTNAKLLLKYSTENKIKIPYFQLGNEPNSYGFKLSVNITPETLAKNFVILSDLIDTYPMYANSLLYGPDVTSLARSASARIFLQRFINAGAYIVIDEVSLHHYYLDGALAKVNDFLNVSVLESLRNLFVQAKAITKSSPSALNFRLTETSSCFGGGAPALSDRYVAGFLWLDKLGMAAQYGTTRVFRQTFLGSAYGLISSTLEPNPDYYLSVLFKRLVEGPVFDVAFKPSNEKLRVYAHCARRGLYNPGALIIYYLNLDNKKVVLSMSQYPNQDFDLYLLTPGDGSGLVSKFVKLNGETLTTLGTVVPAMPPTTHKGDVVVEAQSFGFIVVPQANVILCIDYYGSRDGAESVLNPYQVNHSPDMLTGFETSVFLCCVHIIWLTVLCVHNMVNCDMCT